MFTWLQCSLFNSDICSCIYLIVGLRTNHWLHDDLICASGEQSCHGLAKQFIYTKHVAYCGRTTPEYYESINRPWTWRRPSRVIVTHQNPQSHVTNQSDCNLLFFSSCIGFYFTSGAPRAEKPLFNISGSFFLNKIRMLMLHATSLLRGYML